MMGSGRRRAHYCVALFNLSVTATLGRIGEVVFSELFLMFDVFSCQQRSWRPRLMPCLWWRYTDPGRSCQKGELYCFLICPNLWIGSVCGCVSVHTNGQGDFVQLSFWNYTGSHCITGVAKPHFPSSLVLSWLWHSINTMHTINTF